VSELPAPEPHDEPVADEAPADPHCPVCKVDLQPAFYEAAMIWSCPDCSGTSMTPDELLAITNNESAPRTEDERLAAIDRASEKLPLLDHIRAQVACPWCSEPMGRAVFDGNSGIGIDQCVDCGVLWLDPGELERAEAWREARRAGLQPEA
jgi:Zn-finger nucleic acid-binding protein